MNVPQRVVLDLDSREIPVNAEQEHSGLKRALRVYPIAPLLLFNGEGNCCISWAAAWASSHLLCVVSLLSSIVTKA